MYDIYRYIDKHSFLKQSLDIYIYTYIYDILIFVDQQKSHASPSVLQKSPYHRLEGFAHLRGGHGEPTAPNKMG